METITTMETCIPVAVGLVIPLTIYIAHVSYRWLHSSSPSEHFTLKLRHLKKSGAEMMGGSECNNIFVDEYLKLADLMAPLVDCCVMRVVDDKMPILSKQEALHAKMHNQAKVVHEREEGLMRWSWCACLGRFVLLRAGDQIGGGCCGSIEVTAGFWLHLPMVFWPTRGCMNDEAVFHALEEMEHASLTSEHIRSQIHPLMPLITFPIMSMVYFTMMLLPPVVAILHRPWLLLNPKAHVDIILYYMSYIPTFLVTIAVSIIFWVLPFRVSSAFYLDKKSFYENEAKRRGIEFAVIEEVTYRTDGVVLEASSKN